MNKNICHILKMLWCNYNTNANRCIHYYNKYLKFTPLKYLPTSQLHGFAMLIRAEIDFIQNWQIN